MKASTIIGFILIFIISNIQGQISSALGNLTFEDTLSLRPRSSWINIPDSVNNIWEVGSPDKLYLDLGYNNDIALITDSNNFYSNNCNDYFSISIPWSENIWGEGILSFYHKFDTDTLQDGGIIEISYDNGNSWISILDDTNHININFFGLSKDSLISGDCGFSGKSDGWQYVELYWYWIGITRKKSTSESLDTPIVRFRFVSDNNNTNKDGWMIDNIIFRGYDVIGSVSNLENDYIKIFPNPTNDYFEFKSVNEKIEDYSFRIVDINGRLIKNISVINQKVDISDLGSGTYIIKLQKENRIITGKVVKF